VRGAAAGAPDQPRAATKTGLRSLARRWQQLQAELDRIDLQLQALVSAAAPTLLALPGVGVDTAGQLLVTAGDNPQRLRGEAAFAHLCGVAPIPASSGRTHRHRLNRGGDRQANNAFAADRLGPDALPPKLVTRPVHAGIQQPLRTGAPCVGMGWCMSPTRP